MRTLLKQPLLQFLVLGFLLYAAQLTLRGDSQRKVVLSQQELQQRVQQKEQALGRPLSEAELGALTDQYTDEMILLNEAKLMNLDRSDKEVRKRLMHLARMRLDEVVPEPSRQQLKLYFQQHSSEYRMGAWVSFDQVFFASGSPDTPDDPDSFLTLLARSNGGAGLGEPDRILGGHARELTRSQLRSLFGPAFADTVFALSEGVWNGPFDSTRGTHYLKVLEHHPAPTPRFEDLEAYLRKDWKAMKHREIQNQKLQELRHEYTVVREKD
jgi:hypothetical protein